MAESRLTFENQGGMNLVNATDLLRPTEFAYLQNTRKLLGGRMTARPPMSSNLLGGTLPAGATSVSRLNDPYLPGTPPTYALVVGAAGVMYVSTNGAAPLSVATGLSSNPLSFLPYRPAGTPRPWDYVADPSMAVTIPDYTASGYGDVAGMLKVRADGLIRKTGIKEPQAAPVIAAAAGTGPNWVTYRYVYRDSTTQAVSNPSPESAPQIVPQNSVFGTQAAGTGGTANPNISFNTSQYQFEYFNGSNQIRTEGGVAAGTLTDYVVAANFSLNAAVPTGVTVDGVSVALNWMGQQNDTGVIANVALYYAGSPIGEAKSPGTQNTLSGGTAVYGGGSDPWGAILTPDIVNDPTFGFGVQILAQDSGGTDRSFLYTWTITVYYTTLSSTGTCTGSLDPQVDTIDVYRQTPGLENFTYVLSVPNSSPSFGDSLPDLAIATNPILSYQNYEPFPSIDLPRSGICTVGAVNQEVSSIAILSPGTGQTNGTPTIYGTGGGGTGAAIQITIAGGVITEAKVTAGGSGYTSAPTFTVAEGGTPGTLAATLSPVLPLAPNVTSTGGTDVFNIRWLPGTIILIQQPGQNSSVAYVLYNRPGSTTELTAYTTTTSATGFIAFSFPPAGSSLTWQIAEPDLAAQPSPVIWGPTPDNAGSFYFGLDPNNPGDLVWSLGNNFDSASDSNRLYVTSPSEMLMNGTVTSELSTVFSTDRFWLIYPNFSDAVAAVTGTLGQQWSLVQSASTRGLYMRYAIGALGSLIAWRGKDGIFISQGGGPEQEISAQIYNLFPHSQSETPSPVVIGGNTVYPPDDTKPNAQTITLVPGYIFYDYQDTTGVPRTLVYDMEAKGWSVDTYTPTANCHAWAIGDVNQILLGCTDGTVRQFANSGTESATAVLSTGCVNSGDARAQKILGDIFCKALITTSNPVSLALYADRYSVALGGYSPTSLTGSGSLASYVVDFTSGDGDDLIDIAAQFSWPVGSGNVLEWWEPSWTQLLPDSINDRPTAWSNAEYPGNKLIRGLVLELDTFNVSKTFGVERSDDNTLRTPGQVPVTINGQTLTPFTFATPFTAHDLRIISTDGVPWRRSPDAGWNTKWIFDPWPEYAPLRSEWSNLGQQGAKYIRGLVIPLDTNGSSASFAVVTSDGGSVTFTATTTAAKKTPVSFAFNPPIVAHDVQLQMNSNAAVWFEEIRWDFDPYPELTPEYTPIMEIGGPGNKFVQGVKLIADTANIPVTFQVLYDGGQTGPTFTGTFDGKQTLVFSWTPFTAHDIQIVPQGPARVWYGGTPGGTSEWVFEPYPERALNWDTELTALDGVGWQWLEYMNVEYSATAAITLAFTVDSGNGSIAPATVTLPSTGGVQTKTFFWVTPNKWKLLAFSATSSAAFYAFAEGMEVWIGSWGGKKRQIKPIGGPSASGAKV